VTLSFFGSMVMAVGSIWLTMHSRSRRP
jgi:hypothetical protein